MGSDGIQNGEEAEFEEGVLSGDREDWDAVDPLDPAVYSSIAGVDGDVENLASILSAAENLADDLERPATHARDNFMEDLDR